MQSFSFIPRRSPYRGPHTIPHTRFFPEIQGTRKEIIAYLKKRISETYIPARTMWLENRELWKAGVEFHYADMLGPTDEQRKADMWLVQLGLLPPFDYDFVAASGLSSTTQFSPEPVAPLAPSTKSAGLRWRNLLARIQPRTTSLGKILRMGSNGSLTVSEDSRWSSGSDRTNSLFSVESVSTDASSIPSSQTDPIYAEELFTEPTSFCEMSPSLSVADIAGFPGPRPRKKPCIPKKVPASEWAMTVLPMKAPLHGKWLNCSIRTMPPPASVFDQNVPIASETRVSAPPEVLPYGAWYDGLLAVLGIPLCTGALFTYIVICLIFPLGGSDEDEADSVNN